MKSFLVLSLFAMLGLCWSAHACLGTFSETITFLDRLPEKALEKDVVAKVRIVSAQTDNQSEIKAKTKVLDGVKGCKKGATIKVEVRLTSCSREPMLKKGQTYFLAGAIDADGVFRGEWLRDLVRAEK